MKIPFFTLDRQNEQLENLINDTFGKVISKGDFILGEQVAIFEDKFKKYLGVDHCISCGNGTDALELILEGLEIQPGDEVIIPDNTWMSLAEAVFRTGGVPVCCDVDESSFNLSVETVEAAITDKTFAVIGVHQYGQPFLVDELLEITRKKNILLIEDCAHAAGASISKKRCGSLADAASYSFYPTKNLGAFGDGGAVTTDNKLLAEKIRLLRNHGQLKRDIHKLSGRNSRLDEIQAALLSVKLDYLDTWNERRVSIAVRYCELLTNISQIVLPQLINGHIYHQFVLKTENRDSLKDFLADNSVQTAIHYPATIRSLGITNQKNPFNPIAESLSGKVLSLPIFPELTEEEINYITELIRNFYLVI